jgi:Ca2+-transporting ATPase
MRVRAVAEKDVPDGTTEVRPEDVAAGGFRLLGLEGMIDPPRPEATAAVKACRDAGMQVKMITGDHRKTAEAIARDLGFAAGEPALTGADLARLDDAGFARAAARTHVFARVAPEHKLRLVRALQADRQVVAMTGDGVNDAPALKQANIGVAMGITGTSVAREAADVVLTDDNFATIVAAVEEGRRVWDNLVKALAFVLPTSLGLALILVAAVVASPMVIVAGEPTPLLPMLPVQILWINLVSAVALSLPLAFEVKERNVMARPPRAPDAPVLGRFVVARTALVAVLMAAGALGLFLWEYRDEVGRQGHQRALAEAQTEAVTTVFLFQALYLWMCRSLRDPIRHIGWFSNRIVFLGLGAMAVLQAAFIYAPPLQRLFKTAPLGPEALWLSAAVAVVILPVIAIEKAVRRRRAAREADHGRANA